MHRISNWQGMALLSILFALIIIGLVYYLATKNSKKNADPSHKGFLKEAGLDNSSYKSTLDSTKKALDAAVATRSQNQ